MFKYTCYLNVSVTYVLKKIIGGKPYFYLVKNVRAGGAWKKFTVYMGKGPIGRGDLEKLRKAHTKTLDQKVAAYLKATDPLLGLLSERQLVDLEKVKAAYRKAKGQMSAAVRRRWYEWFLATFTYNSNAIEGSTVNLLQTSAILFEGLTPPGKTTREVREVENHRRAFDYMAGYRGELSKAFVCKLHRLMTAGILPPAESGAFRSVQVFVRGSEIIPPRPEDVAKSFKGLMLWYRGNKRRYHPVVVAAYLHAAFEGIHPFVDYNGRTGRLLLNYQLMRNGFPPIAIAYRGRAKYYRAIQAAIKGDLRPLARLVHGYLTAAKF